MQRMGMVMLIAGCMLGSGCDPFKEQREAAAEKKRIECLDKLCEGDVQPKRDTATEVAIKINGQWYVGPKAYFAGNRGAVFYWPGRSPAFAGGDFPPGVKGRDFADVAIEVFLSTPRTPGRTSTHQTLLEEEVQGRVVEKLKARDGLEVWKTKSGGIHETWFIATDLRLPTNEPPVIACRGEDPAANTCTGGFLWTPDIAAGLRFRATHGPDWPEIYLEITRVLQQLRRG